MKFSASPIWPVLPLWALGMILSAQGDVTIEMTMQNSFETKPVVIRVKGDKMRQDIGEDVTSYKDCTTWDEVVVEHKTKQVSRRDGAQTREAMEFGKKKRAEMGLKTAAPPPFVSTGKQEKVGPYLATIYKQTILGGTTTLYLAKDVPNYDAIKAELAVLNKLPDQEEEAKLDGIVVKRVLDFPGAYQSTRTVVSIKYARLEAAEVTPPAK